jgi:hypothetical protein
VVATPPKNAKPSTTRTAPVPRASPAAPRSEASKLGACSGLTGRREGVGAVTSAAATLPSSGAAVRPTPVASTRIQGTPTVFARSPAAPAAAIAPTVAAAATSGSTRLASRACSELAAVLKAISGKSGGNTSSARHTA